jgi:hypothetical protein
MSRPLSWDTISAGIRPSLPGAAVGTDRDDDGGRRRLVARQLGRHLDEAVRLARGDRLRAAEDQLLAGLDDKDRQTFRALLQQVAVHAATALDFAAPQPCTEPPPGNC